jgi:hypothetical protein
MVYIKTNNSAHICATLCHSTISDSVPSILIIRYTNGNLIMWKEDQRFKNGNVNMTITMIFVSTCANNTSESSNDTYGQL